MLTLLLALALAVVVLLAVGAGAYLWRMDIGGTSSERYNTRRRLAEGASMAEDQELEQYGIREVHTPAEAFELHRLMPPVIEIELPEGLQLEEWQRRFGAEWFGVDGDQVADRHAVLAQGVTFESFTPAVKELVVDLMERFDGPWKLVGLRQQVHAALGKVAASITFSVINELEADGMLVTSRPDLPADASVWAELVPLSDGVDDDDDDASSAPSSASASVGTATIPLVSVSTREPGLGTPVPSEPVAFPIRVAIVEYLDTDHRRAGVRQGDVVRAVSEVTGRERGEVVGQLLWLVDAGWVVRQPRTAGSGKPALWCTLPTGIEFPTELCPKASPPTDAAGDGPCRSTSCPTSTDEENASAASQPTSVPGSGGVRAAPGAGTDVAS